VLLVVDLNLPIIQGMTHQIILGGVLGVNGLSPGFRFTVQYPSDPTARLVIESSVSLDGGASWKVFDTDYTSGGPAPSGIPQSTCVVRIPSNKNVNGAIVKARVVQCVGTFVLLSAGVVTF
jgi:hypothetical protein